MVGPLTVLIIADALFFYFRNMNIHHISDWITAILFLTAEIILMFFVKAIYHAFIRFETRMQQWKQNVRQPDQEAQRIIYYDIIRTIDYLNMLV